MSESNENRPVTGLSTNRLQAFSDGVFAVAITLLVLNLQVPQITSVSELVPRLGELWPKLLSYALSFVLVGIYWVAHHNTFNYIQRSDRNLLWLNIMLLMCIVFLPFPTALLGQYPEQRVSVIIYAGTLVITGLVLQTLWWYATSCYRLVDRNIDPRLVQRATRRNLTGPLLYLLAIGISLFSVPASLVLFFLVPLYYIFPGRIDRHWARRPSSRFNETRGSSDGDAGLSSEEAVHLRKSSVEER
jgi:uncharacterized membrane protein